MTSYLVHQAYLEGQKAARQGLSSENPHTPVRHTALGTPVYNEVGIAWREGFGSVGRRASAKEVADAAALDVRNFGRRYRREG